MRAKLIKEEKDHKLSTLFNKIEDNIRSNIYLRDVPYSLQDGDKELDPDSVNDAVKSIISEIKEYMGVLINSKIEELERQIDIVDETYEKAIKMSQDELSDLLEDINNI